VEAAPAVDHEPLPGDEARPGRGEEGDGVRDLLRRPEAPGRDGGDVGVADVAGNVRVALDQVSMGISSMLPLRTAYPEA